MIALIQVLDRRRGAVVLHVGGERALVVEQHLPVVVVLPQREVADLDGHRHVRRRFVQHSLRLGRGDADRRRGLRLRADRELPLPIGLVAVRGDGIPLDRVDAAGDLGRVQADEERLAVVVVGIRLQIVVVHMAIAGVEHLQVRLLCIHRVRENAAHFFGRLRVGGAERGRAVFDERVRRRKRSGGEQRCYYAQKGERERAFHPSSE